MSMLNYDEYDEQNDLESGRMEYKIQKNLKWLRDDGVSYVTVTFNDMPEWRKIFFDENGCYVNIGTNRIYILESHENTN